MNYVAVDYLDFLMQSGVKRRSGRYRFGSGETPYQHEPWFTWGKNEWLNQYWDYEEQGLTNKQIAEKFGMSPTALKAKYSNAVNNERIKMISGNEALIQAGYLNRSERARMMGVNESTIRSLENSISRERTERARKTADTLKEQVDRLGPIDISTGAETQLGVSKAKLKQAVKILEDEGYEVYTGRNEQITNQGKFTTVTALCPPGTGHMNKNGKLVSDVVYHPEELHLIDIQNNLTRPDMTSDDGGKTFRKAFQYPASMDSKRVFIRYGDQGGTENDGTIEIRPGVADLSLGESNYAQVRILVDGDKYMKGMAHYMDPKTAVDIPEGYDVVYNTRKPSGTAPEKVFKAISKDPDNPFGSLIKENGGQSTYTDPVTGEKKLSLINKRADEGDWDEWADKLPSQFLAKQRKELVTKQLNLSIAEKQEELDTIMSLDNPTLKKQFLLDFAQGADKAAVTLKAAALPGQKYKVILPVNTLSDQECYCPEYDNGTKLALIRFPHGGTFEIPILTVNNRNPEGKAKLGTNAIDGIGINHNNAERLSGADFDGDTVLIIPNADKQNILSTPKLKGLEGFDPEAQYGYGDIDISKKKIMTERYKQIQMGIVTNLLMDATMAGATDDEKAAITRHSMVVIDAVKHELDYTRSYKDNNIDFLKKKYQGHYDLDGEWKESGASTIITRAKNETTVPKTQGDPHIDPETGELVYKPKSKVIIDVSTGEKKEVPDPYYVDKNGKKHYYTQKTTQMDAVKDARLLISDTQNPIEVAYAEYANALKAMANTARKESTKDLKLVYNPEAAKEYADVIDVLKNKIVRATANKPLERAAQREARIVSEAKFKLDDSLTEKDKGKIRQQALTAARLKYGAERYSIDVSDREWEAIQAGAISDNMLRQIMQYADTDKLKERAMPRPTVALSDAKISLIRSMSNSNYTIAQIAERLGISSSTVKKYLKAS